MLDSYERLSNQQKNTFSDIANKLLSYTFLARDKRDNKENYYFVVSFKDIFDEFFKVLGYEVFVDQALGVAYVKSDLRSLNLKLNRDETVILLILRLLYHEKLKETSLNENIIIQVQDILEKYNYLELRKRLTKSDLERTLRLYKRYNLIETFGDVTMANTKIALLPTLLFAIKTEDINEVYQTVNRIMTEAGE